MPADAAASCDLAHGRSHDALAGVQVPGGEPEEPVLEPCVVPAVSTSPVSSASSSPVSGPAPVQNKEAEQRHASAYDTHRLSSTLRPSHSITYAAL